MNIALVEDNTLEADVLLKFLKRYAADKDVKLDVTHYKNAEDFLKSYKH